MSSLHEKDWVHSSKIIALGRILVSSDALCLIEVAMTTSSCLKFVTVLSEENDTVFIYF